MSVAGERKLADPEFRVVAHINHDHPSGYEIGDLVHHPTYGEGHVVKLNDDGGVRVRWHGVGGTVNA